MGPNARLAQWESACLTRRWSQVQILHRALSGPERGRADRAGWRGYYRLDRSAPFPDRPALRAGHRNSLARRRRATASSDASVPSFCERGGSPRGEPPLSHFPPGQAGAEPPVRRHLFSRARRYAGGPNAHRRPRRSAGTAWNADFRSAPRPAGPRTAHRRPRKSAAGPGNADLRSARALPMEKERGRARERRSSDRHRGPQGRERRAAEHPSRRATPKNRAVQTPSAPPECVGNERNPPGTLTVGLPF